MDNPNALEEKNSAFYFAGYEEGERYIGPGNELFNRATHMSPIRLNLVQIGNKILPEVLFSQVNDTENLDVFESCLHEVLKSKIVWSKLCRKDILEQLLKIFGVWAAPRIFRGQQTLEDQMGGLAAQAQRK